MSKTVEMWKIRDKLTGLFSPGGGMSFATFTKKGKTWSEKRHVMSHISNNQNYYRKRAANLEIVKMILTEDEALEMGPEFDALMERRELKEQKDKIARSRAKLRHAESQKRKAEKEIRDMESLLGTV